MLASGGGRRRPTPRSGPILGPGKGLGVACLPRAAGMGEMMDKKLAKSIGDAARQARKEMKLTQEDAAELVGVSVEFYARIERGNSLPSVPTFARIANALGVSADTLIGRESDGPTWQPMPPPAEGPEIRRIVRLLRRATPATLRLVTMLAKEMEKTAQPAPDKLMAALPASDGAVEFSVKA